MKRLIFLMVLCAAVASAAQEKLQGWCQYGGQTVTVSGTSSTDYWNQSYPSCTVTVYDVGTTDLATIYSDEGVTPKANPFTASSVGYWFFYAADGDYDVRFSGAGIAVPFTLSDFSLYSAGAGITSLGGLTGATQTFANGTNVTISSAGTEHTLGWTGDLAVADGGTGAGTFTANGILYGNTTSAIQVTAAGSAYEPLRVPSGGGAPAFGALDISQGGTSVTGQLPIAYGGTAAATALGAINAISPLTTKGDLIVHNGTNNIREAIGTDGQCLQADSAQSSGINWASCLGASPVTVANGGTGAATLTGAVIGNGASAMTAVAASSDLDILRRQPNQTSTTYHFSSPPYVVSSDFDFPSQAPGGTLTAAVGATPTMTPCPLGVNGADSSHYLYISGGTGAAEAVLITGGTCTSGAASGTIGFTPANSHSGAWTITSATDGVQEAVCYLPSGNNRVIVPQGTTTLNATVAWCGETDAEIFISNGVTLAGSGVMPSPDYDDLNIYDNRAHIKINSGTIPICQKYTVNYDDGDFIVASTTATVTLFQLPTVAKITGVVAKHSTAFTDGGGAMTDVDVEIGSAAGATDEYLSTSSIGEGTAAAATTFYENDQFHSYTVAADNVEALFTATTRDFGDGGSTYLTAGSVDIHVCFVNLED